MSFVRRLRSSPCSSSSLLSSVLAFLFAGRRRREEEEEGRRGGRTEGRGRLLLEREREDDDEIRLLHGEEREVGKEEEGRRKALDGVAVMASTARRRGREGRLKTEEERKGLDRDAAASCLLTMTGARMISAMCLPVFVCRVCLWCGGRLVRIRGSKQGKRIVPSSCLSLACA